MDPKDQILLDLSKLNISSHILETTDWKKFLGVLLDKNLTQKEQINSVENKIAESIPILIKRRTFSIKFKDTGEHSKWSNILHFHKFHKFLFCNVHALVHMLFRVLIIYEGELKYSEAKILQSWYGSALATLTRTLWACGEQQKFPGVWIAILLVQNNFSIVMFEDTHEYTF